MRNGNGSTNSVSKLLDDLRRHIDGMADAVRTASAELNEDGDADVAALLEQQREADEDDAGIEQEMEGDYWSAVRHAIDGCDTYQAKDTTLEQVRDELRQLVIELEDVIHGDNDEVFRDSFKQMAEAPLDRKTHIDAMTRNFDASAAAGERARVVGFVQRALHLIVRDIEWTKSASSMAKATAENGLYDEVVGEVIASKLRYVPAPDLIAELKRREGK